MRPRIALLAVLVAAPALVTAGPAAAVGPVQGLTCGLATSGRAGVLTGGPLAVTGELATAVIVTCTVLVNGTPVAAPSGLSAGPVGVLPPTPVTVPAVPGRDRVDVCTSVEWIFGFPGSGSFDLGCQTATARTGLLPGYTAIPELVT